MVTVRQIKPGDMRAGIAVGLRWAGWESPDIADMIGVRTAKVEGILLGAGEQPRGGVAVLPVPLIAKRYAAGEGARALAVEFDTTSEHVTGIAEGAGLIAEHGGAKQRLARRRDPWQALPAGRLTTGRRVLAALAAHPQGLTTAQAAGLDGRAGEVESGGTRRRRVVALYGQVLGRLGRAGLARRAGDAPSGHGAGLWVITSRGQAVLAADGRTEAGNDVCTRLGCCLH